MNSILCSIQYVVRTYMTAWLGFMPWHNSLTHPPTSMCDFSVVCISPCGCVSLTEPYSPVCTSHAVVLLNWSKDKYTVWTSWTVKYGETIGIEGLKARVTQSMMNWWTTTLHLAALSCGCVSLTVPYSPDCTSHAAVLLNWREDKYTVRTSWTVKCS